MGASNSSNPTLAGSTPFEDRKAEYVQFKDRVLMYPLRPVIGVEGPSGRPIIDALFNWRKTTEPSSAGPREADAFIELVIEGVDRAISRAAEELAEGDLLFQRESASIAGSPTIATAIIATKCQPKFFIAGNYSDFLFEATGAPLNRNGPPPRSPVSLPCRTTATPFTRISSKPLEY